MDVQNFGALLFMDLNVKHGDFLQGFINARGGISTSSFFYGLCENQTELNWVLASATDVLTGEFLSGKTSLPAGMRLKEPVLESGFSHSQGGLSNRIPFGSISVMM